MLTGPTRTIKTARRLRKEMSLPEVLLWKVLRTKPGGLKFRRQQPAGRYVLDFYCHEQRLAVEVDGEVHSLGDRPQRDEARDEALSAIGVTTLRIPAREVLRDLDCVLRHIVSSANAAPLHPPPTPAASAGGPPPLDGEDVPLCAPRSL